MGQYISLYTREKIKEIIRDILEFDDCQDLDWLISLGAQGASKQELYADYISTVNKWLSMLKNYQDEQEFEICADIVKILEIEEANFVMILSQYCKEYKRKEDNQIIKDIMTESKELYNL